MTEQFISYFIPQNIKQAQLLVYDGGILIKKVDIQAKGAGSVLKINRHADF